MLRVTVIAALATIALQSTQAPPPIRSGTSLVTVDAVVLDDQHTPMSGLTAGDFTVLEDCEPMPITNFIAPQAVGGEGSGRLVVLVLDDYSPPTHIDQIKSLARRFVDKAGAHDVIAVIALNGDKAVTSTSPEVARAAISRFRPSPPTIIPVSSRNEIVLKAFRDLAGQLEGVKGVRKT